MIQFYLLLCLAKFAMLRKVLFILSFAVLAGFARNPLFVNISHKVRKVTQKLFKYYPLRSWRTLRETRCFQLCLAKFARVTQRLFKYYPLRSRRSLREIFVCLLKLIWVLEAYCLADNPSIFVESIW